MKKYSSILFVVGLLLNSNVMAQRSSDSNWPIKPIRMLLGYAPGGGSDIIARLVAKQLGDRLGQNVVVENHPGAGGTIATDLAAKANPDGYTLYFAPSAHASTAAIRTKGLSYDPVNDFSWIGMVTTYPIAFTVLPDSKFNSLTDFIQAARNEPGKYTYSSVGVGSAMHLVGEWTFSEAKVDVIHVPFKGGTQPFQELLAGRVDVMIDTMTLTASLLKDKRVKLLATTAPKGSSPYSNVLTVADNYPGVTYESWLGVAGPANISPVIVERINKELRSIVNDSDFRQRLIDFGGKPFTSSPSEFKARVAKDIESLSRVAQKQNIRPE